MNLKIVAPTLFVVLTACAERQIPPPAISDISNADSLVRIQARNVGDFFTPKWPEESDVMKEGETGCQHFKKPAVLLSTRCIKTANPGRLFDWCEVREYLFACRIE